MEKITRGINTVESTNWIYLFSFYLLLGEASIECVIPHGVSRQVSQAYQIELLHSLHLFSSVLYLPSLKFDTSVLLPSN